MGQSRTKTALIAAVATLWPALASPQGAGGTGGFQIDIGVSSTLRFDDNFTLAVASPGPSSIWDTNLTFGISSISSTQTFRLTGGGVLRFADIPGRSVAGLEDPNVRLFYALEALDSRLTFDARYRHVDREFLDPFQVEREENSTGSLVGDGGTLTTQSAALTYETGLQGPLSFLVGLRHSERDFANVTNPALFDSVTDAVNASVGLQVSPVTNVSLNAGVTWYDAEDLLSTERETTDISVGLQTEINQSTTLSASLGYNRIETTQIGTSTRHGTTASVALNRQLPNGDASISFATTQNVTGFRHTLTVARNLQLPRGSLGGSLGLTRGETGTTKVIGRLAYTHQLKTDTFNVTLSRSASINSLDEDVIDTRLALGYAHEINNNSRLNVTLDYGLTEDGGAGTANRIERANLRAAYARDLTKDWSLQGGVLFRVVDDASAAGEAQSASVFLTVDRNFSFRP